MAYRTTPDISVIICTRDRPESLRETLRCLAAAERGTLHCHVIVVVNGREEQSAHVAREFAGELSIQVLFELQAGKPYALNRALSDGKLGQIVAVLDDDMSPRRDWFLGVKAICDRWPDKDVFTGSSYIIWPHKDVPAWARHPSLAGWAYSIMNSGPTDRLLAAGRWYSGNHFWFKSRVLAQVSEFPTDWVDRRYVDVSQARFILQLSEAGFGGVSGGDAVCGHRVQPELLRLETIRNRARQVGRGFAVARLLPEKSSVKQARLFHRHPVLSRAFCLTSVMGWSMVRGLLCRASKRPALVTMRLKAIERASTYAEYLRIARREKSYRVVRRGGGQLRGLAAHLGTG